MSFYGYKLHAVYSVNGVFQSIDANITLETQTPKESTQKITSHSFACLKSTEKELKHYSLCYVTNL
ncbi:hypothetical protein EG339_01240 [Chryseobacterium bernardetii]|uniref:Transposase DDE domain-containing protein n=1 Tax=Chryseobacterium bernardetii TaxID=1241978 RepID=A0A3G6T607_9FLAO|nr:hypothetical protein EG339_01240 [Chryseobacterium bernardetii]